MKSIAIKNAFAGGAHGACWLDDERIASAGADGTVKVVRMPRAMWWHYVLSDSLDKPTDAGHSFLLFDQHTITRHA